MKLKKHTFFLLSLIIQFKLELSPQNIHNEPLLCILFGYNQSARDMGVLTGLNSWWLPCQWARCYQNAALCITGRAILSCRINGSLTFIGGSFVAPTHASTKVIHPKYYKPLAYILAHGHTNWGFVCSKPRVYSTWDL